jgi:hypothetical protein
MRTALSLALIEAFLAFGLPTIGSAQTKRTPAVVTLTSVDGQILEAVVLGSRDTSVLLTRADRKRFAVPLERFDLDSQKVIAEQLLAGCEVTPIPEIMAECFDPRLDRDDLLPGTIHIRICRSGTSWWSRLHVGDFGGKPASFRSVEFTNSAGAKAEIAIPHNCVFTGSVRGGKEWTAQEFTLPSSDLAALVPLLAGGGPLTIAGISEEGKRIQADPGQVAPFVASLALCSRVQAFGADPAFGNGVIPPFTDRFEERFASAKRILSPSPLDLRDGTGQVRSGMRIDGFRSGYVRVIDPAGDESIMDLRTFAPDTLAELMSRYLEAEYSFHSSADTGLEYFRAPPVNGTVQGNVVPNLELGRTMNRWRPALWLVVPVADVAGSNIERLRIFVDDAPGFALTSSTSQRTGRDANGTNYFATTFHAPDLGNGQFETVRSARRIRFELVQSSQSLWVEARPDEVEQIRNAVINYSLMRTLDQAGAPARPLL